MFEDQVPDPGPTDSAADEDLLREIRERYDDADAQWSEIRAQAATDMRYMAGDPWEPEDRAARVEAGRPVLALDELGQYVNQTVNGLRQNKRGIKVSPAGNGATDETATFRQGKIRDIEYQSNAQQAYTCMGENALQRSYGFLRIKARFVHEGFDQELVIEPVVNPDLVTPDPYHLRPDGTDMRFLFYREERSVAEFKREYPRARVVDFSTAQSVAPSWVTSDGRVHVAEYWRKYLGRRRVKFLIKPAARSLENPNPQPFELWEDELLTKPSSEQVLKRRTVDVFKVCKHITNGVEILETSDWPGQSIPWVTCYGKVMYVDGKKQILSMIRLARDPYMLYCYYRTCEAELVGSTTKNPVWAYEGQLSPDQLVEVQKSVHVPVAALFAKATVEGLPPGTVLPLPQQNRFEPPIQALEAGAEAARRAIQAAMGISPLPTSALRRNEKSGVALKEMADSEQKGTFHFVDHYDESITRTGAILNELIPYYYDTARETSIRKPNDDVAVVRINDEAAMQDGKQAYLPTNQGDHDVTITVGPFLASEREASSAFADSIVGNPEIAQVVGSQKMQLLLAAAIKLKGLGPIGDEMAEIISPKPDGDPQQAQQQAAQLQQQVQELGQQLQKAAQIIQMKQTETTSREKIAWAEIQAKKDIADVDADKELALQVMKNAATIAVAHIAASAKGAALDAHAAEEAQALGADATSHALEDRQEMRMATLAQEQALESAEHAAELAPETAYPGSAV